jgi:raffinose/stachyose/melibiose transport system substrate-binding protein
MPTACRSPNYPKGEGMKATISKKGKLAVVATASALALSGVLLTPAQAADKVITLWHIQNTDPGPKLIQDAVNRFQSENPGYKVEVSTMANDAFKDKLKVAMGANNAPCIFPTWGGGPLNAYVKANQVIDLTSYLAKDNYKNRFVPASWANVTFNKKSYGVPVENSSIAVIWYNKAIFAKYKLKTPKTWNQLMSITRTLKSKDIAAFTLAGGSKWPSIMWYDYLVDRIGGSTAFTSAALRTGGKFTDPAFIKAGEMIQDLIEAGGFVKGYNGLSYDNSQQRAPLYAGKAAMQLMGNWEYYGFAADNKADDFGFFPFPSVVGGKGDPTSVLGTVGDNFYSVSTKCAEKDAAFKVIQYLIDDKAVAARVEAGRIPPVKGVKLTDPFAIELNKLIEKAGGVQLWWDQYLPPEFAGLHLDQTQALFGLSQTPKGMAEAQEALAVKLLGASKK